MSQLLRLTTRGKSAKRSRGWTVEDSDKFSITGGKSEDGGQHTRKGDFLAGAWPLKPFSEDLPSNQRMAEWIRFRNQYERIAACKGEIDAEMKLLGLKVFAGSYLLNVIEVQENRAEKSGKDSYQAVVESVGEFFRSVCDEKKERLRLREMRMAEKESFADWFMRLEAQAKLCGLTEDQKAEELVQAMIRRSVPEIAGKLFEMVDLLGNDLEKIVRQGKHLDFVRSETGSAYNKRQEVSEIAAVSYASRPASTFGAGGWHRGNPSYRPNYWVRQEGASQNKLGATRPPIDNRRVNHREPCWRCNGKFHSPQNCHAMHKKCRNCHVMGHLERACRTNLRTAAKRHSEGEEGSSQPTKMQKIAALTAGGTAEEMKRENVTVTEVLHVSFLHRTNTFFRAAGAYGSFPCISIASRSDDSFLFLSFGSCSVWKLTL